MQRSDDLTTRVLSKIDGAFPDYTIEYTLRSTVWAGLTAGTTARERYTIPLGLENIVAVRIESDVIDGSTDSVAGGWYVAEGGAMDAVDVEMPTNPPTIKLGNVRPVHNSAGGVTANTGASVVETFVFRRPFSVGTTTDADVFLVTDISSVATGSMRTKITIYCNATWPYSYPGNNVFDMAELADLP